MRLSLRLALIVGTTIALVVMALFFAFLGIQKPLRSFGVVLPRPSRVLAMAELLEKTPQENWSLTTAALSSAYVSVGVINAPPVTKGEVPMPGVTRVLHIYQLALAGRPVALMAEIDPEINAPNLEIDTETVRSTSPVRLLVTLRNGKILMLEARRPLSERFNGVRLGFLALAITIFISVISLWIIRNQLRPLERLAKAVEKFGSRLEASQLPEEGTSELRQLTAAFNRLQSNIGDLLAGRTRIISAVGHDIGTYLTRLRLRAEYIGDASQREKAIRDIDDMNALMRETLALAKLDHDEAIPVDLVTLLKKQADAFADQRCVVRYVGSVEPIWVRATGLERALANLISNALKYGSEATLAAERREANAHITVEDRGPGIPLDERNAVLEPFYRLDTARNLNDRGFGLGLTIVSEVVKNAGGTLAFEDREEGGLRVRIVLPLAQTGIVNP